MEQPLKAATPAVVVAVQPVNDPGPDAMLRVTACVFVVTVLPPASRIVTTGCVPKALPPVAAPGSVVNARWVAVPVPTAKDALVLVKLSVASVAVRVYVPTVLIAQPLKAATPAVVVEVQPEREPGPEWMVRVIAWVFPVAVFPPAS
jgi:hypothetical protein